MGTRKNLNPFKMNSYLMNALLASPLLSIPFVLFATEKSEENEWLNTDFANFCEDGFEWNSAETQCQRIITHPDFFRRIADNYRTIASVILDIIGVKEMVCEDENCSNLDGTALALIHVMAMKILTYTYLFYKERYSHTVNNFVSKTISNISLSMSTIAAQKSSELRNTLRTSLSYCGVRYRKTKNFLENDFLQPEAEMESQN